MLEIVADNNKKIILTDDGRVLTDSEEFKDQFAYDINKDKTNISLEDINING